MATADHHILQAGVARSGNMWLYHIIEELRKEAGVPSRSFVKQQPIYSIAQRWRQPLKRISEIDTILFFAQRPYYVIGGTYRMPVEDFASYVAQTSHVWTHNPAASPLHHYFEHFDKILYVIRDPRDALISFSHFGNGKERAGLGRSEAQTPTRFVQSSLHSFMRQWVQNVGTYLLLKAKNPDQVHLVFYEHLLANFERTVQSIAEHLDLIITGDSMQRVKESTSFARMQPTMGDHLRVGTSRQWVDDLSSTQQREVFTIAGLMIDTLQYPKTAADSDQLPREPTAITKRQIVSCIKRARRHTWQEKRAFLRAHWHELLP